MRYGAWEARSVGVLPENGGRTPEALNEGITERLNNMARAAKLHGNVAHRQAHRLRVNSGNKFAKYAAAVMLCFVTAGVRRPDVHGTDTGMHNFYRGGLSHRAVYLENRQANTSGSPVPGVPLMLHGLNVSPT